MRVRPGAVALMSAAAVLFMSAVALRWWLAAAVNAVLFVVAWRLAFGGGVR